MTVPPRQSPLLRAVLGQIEWWWDTTFRPRLDGLGQRELEWEPVPGCWRITPTEDGLVAYDFEWPPPHPAPFTTIGWRLCHIGIGCLANRASVLFPESVTEPITTRLFEGPLPFPSTADEVLAFLDRWWAIWIGGLRDAGDEWLWEPIGDREWDVPEMQLGTGDPVIGLVLHVHRELMHHGGEIGVLRDLYRSTYSTATTT